ncbi:MAG TPA: CDGSH iron-sulfur domain-containing protein [Thiotrichales bacterium]|nr:CDGSH iron-sulfur domain-containing protein [Thiotrichales bacterium]
MTEPVITQKKPFVMELEAGTYHWCSCGRSKNQPFCDGSHKGTGMEPVEFRLAEKQQVWLCGCRHSKTIPFCDGAHKTL